MNEMIQAAGKWMQNIESGYSVNPYIFGAIYVLCIAPFWFSLYKVLDSLRKKIMDRVLFWMVILAVTVLAPFIYVAIFGRNLPWWFWFIIAAAVGISAFSVVRKIAAATAEKRMD